ncbi:hypothetical protein GWI33_020927 [Rhynchophorus ferrugineus]|uniref:Peptidase S1 domain-containing protein n=1 Tax=Rhynchophorus ferrugineus TaxID=354439 RepID=A0A834I2N6_RHYFE|nr:hypothetical protein GWI33_020927 [Rhynchophorus ferrugineus]
MERGYRTFTYSLIFFYLFGAFTCRSYEYKEEGSACQQLGVPGICKRLENCKEAIESLRLYGRHDFLRCGFVDIEEVVCCPEIGDRNPQIEATTIDSRVVWGGNTNGNSAKRKSDIMCEKYVKEYRIKSTIEFHIINGVDAYEGQFPHMAALGFPAETDPDVIDFRRCGGSLISTKFVLSAAHCFICAACADPVKARFGVINITDSLKAQDVDVKSTIPHPQYNPTSKHNDIALIELIKDVVMDKLIYPACLYTRNNDPIGLIISGWGNTANDGSDKRSPILQTGEVNPVAINNCNTTIVSKNQDSLKVIVQTQICAISKSDACTGDSGGPLQVQRSDGTYGIVGVVSWGINCGTSIPGIYTRVYSYLDWIEEKVWPG